MKSLSTIHQTQEKLFEEKFPRNQMGGISSEYRDGGKRLREDLVFHSTQTTLAILQGVLEMVEGGKVDLTKYNGDVGYNQYNQALNDLSSTIKAEIDKIQNK